MANRALYELARPIPAEALMFDHWLAQVAAGVGTIAYLDAPTVLYRQHNANAIGARPKSTRSFAARVELIVLSEAVLRVLSRYSQHAAELTARYSHQLAPKDARKARTLAGIWDEPRLKRIFTIMASGLFKASLVTNLGLMALLLRDGRPERFASPQRPLRASARDNAA